MLSVCLTTFKGFIKRNTFVFADNGSFVAESFSSVNEAIAYIKNNIIEIVENNNVNTLYAVIDFENQTTQFVKLQFDVVPA